MRSIVLKMRWISTKYLTKPSMLGFHVSLSLSGDEESSSFASASVSASSTSSLSSWESSLSVLALREGNVLPLMLRSLMATNRISSVMPWFSPGYSFLYLFLFCVTSGDAVPLLVEITAVEFVVVVFASGVEQHKISDREHFTLLHLLFLIGVVEFEFNRDGSEGEGDTENEGYTTDCCINLTLHGVKDHINGIFVSVIGNFS